MLSIALRGGHRRLMTYNLAKPIAFETSKSTPGLQLADCLASALGFSLKNDDDDEAFTWRKPLLNSDAIHEDSMFPEPQRASLKTPEEMLNALVRTELLQRAESGTPLLPGMSEFVKATMAHR